jgi:transcriptional regulator with XRE-family HTH domain
MNYGRAIKIVRTAHGLTLAQLADRVSVGSSYLSLIEAGKRKPSLDVLQEISSALGVPLHLLTLLASDPSEFDSEENAARVADVAKTLVRLLAASGEQPFLPLKKRKKSA